MSLETLIYRHDTHLFKPNTLGKDLLVSVTFIESLAIIYCSGYQEFMGEELIEEELY